MWGFGVLGPKTPSKWKKKIIQKSLSINLASVSVSRIEGKINIFLSFAGVLLVLSFTAVFPIHKRGKKENWVTELIGVILAVTVITIVATTTPVSFSWAAVIGSFTSAPVADLHLGWPCRSLHEVRLRLLNNFLATEWCWGILEYHKGISLYFWVVGGIYVRGRHHVHVWSFYFFYMSIIVLILIWIHRRNKIPSLN